MYLPAAGERGKGEEQLNTARTGRLLGLHFYPFHAYLWEENMP